MLAHIAMANGSPSPTLVLDAAALPHDESLLEPALLDAVDWLHSNGGAEITKIALIKPSAHPFYDLDYRFVQVIPAPGPALDFRGSCGHSILSSAVVASQHGWIPALSPGSRIRVNVLNNLDNVVCEVDESSRGRTTFTAHFVRPSTEVMADSLIFGTEQSTLPFSDGTIRVTGMSIGNPYVFVDARDLGVDTPDALFEADADLYARLLSIKSSAATELGWPSGGAFPKVAAVMPNGADGIAFRALSVPRWHPTIALTGAVCLAAAAKLRGTIPYEQTIRSDRPDLPLRIKTPGGWSTASATTTGTDRHNKLEWVSVPHKRVHLNGPVLIDNLRHYLRKESTSCLPLS